MYKAANSGATVSGFVDVQSGNEAALLDALSTVGPIAVAIDASKRSFQLYTSGKNRGSRNKYNSITKICNFKFYS